MTELEIKRNLNKPVKLTNPKLYIEGSEYILTGATIRKDDKTGEFYYQAELQDKANENSILICRLEDIEKLEG